MINRAVLVGRLTKDPELRYTGSGAAVVTFTVAVNRQFTNSQGEREADFINCVMWRKAAENFANFTHKGSLVGIDGRIQTRSYDNQQGQRVYVTEVVAESFSLLDPKNGQSQPSDNNQSSNNNQNYQSDNSQSQKGYQDNQSSNQNQTSTKNQHSNSNNRTSQRQNDNPFNNSSPIDISDDDLPF